jgi:LppP/LprE lipoprotein
MESVARRVKAERNRQRLPYRSPASRWTRRVAGVLATAAFIGIGVASALMILPDKHKGASALETAALPTATPAAHRQTTAKHGARPKGPTKAQLAALHAAQAELRRQGFTTLDATHYDPTAKLRVLTGRPVGDAGGGTYAFFFLRGSFLSRDSTTPSTKLRVVRTWKAGVMLEYRTYAAGDSACCPSGRAKVRFKLVRGQVQPLDAIPSSRFVRAAA